MLLVLELLFLIKILIFFYLDVSHFLIIIFLNYDLFYFNFIGDGIFDNLNNERILHKIWQSKKKGQVYTDIHQLCNKITDAIIKYSMEKNYVDNVSVIFIAFKNFENKMKDPNFEYTINSKCENSRSEEIDLSNIQIKK